MAAKAIIALFDEAQPQFLKTIVCEDCGVVCKKTGGLQRFCSDCREEGNKRLSRERDLARRPPKVRNGGILSCVRCGVEVVRKHGKQYLCGPCLKPYWLEKATSEREAKRKSSGKELGLTFQCKACRKDVVKTGFKHLYCVPCAELETSKNTAKSHEKHKEKKLVRQKVWRASDSGSEWTRAYQSRPKNKVHSNVSRAVRASITGKGGRSWETLLGYTTEELIVHLQRQFAPGMTWENYGEWHIDHIVPKSSFDFSATTDADFLACWAMTNLRPLWGGENKKKSAKRVFLI